MRPNRFRAPDTALIIFLFIVGAAVLTWFVPPGEFSRDEIEVPGAGTREVVVPGSFEYLDDQELGVVDQFVHSVAIVLQAPIRGFVDPDAAPIIAFVLFIGGAFAVLQATGAVDAALLRMVRASQRSRAVEWMLIPLFMTIFSLGGAVFGMAEETIPFVLIFVPLALALGYDSITGAAIPFVGSAAGFAGAFFNPFTVGIAQGIAGLPPFSGAGFRVIVWAFSTAIAITFVMWHARKVKRDPSRSPTFEDDEKRRGEGAGRLDTEGGFTARQKGVLAVFVLGLIALVWGVLPPDQGGQGWYIIEIAALFIGLGIVMGLVGGLGASETSKSFMNGVRDLATTAVIIGLARGILVVLQDGQVVDTILFAMSTALSETSTEGAAIAMFTGQTVLNFFVPSGSGQAALTMPLMAPLSDLIGVTRQTAVLAFQMGDGFTNMIIPTNPVLMGMLTIAGIAWQKWARWIVLLQVVLFILGVIMLIVAVNIGYGA